MGFLATKSEARTSEARCEYEGVTVQFQTPKKVLGKVVLA